MHFRLIIFCCKYNNITELFYRASKSICNGLPAATFIAKSRVIMPLPASPAAANIIGTPIGNVPSCLNSCTGALPVNLDISRLSLRRLIVLCVWPAPFSTNSLTSNSSSIASAASHLGGLPVGGCNIVTVLASASMATSRTISAAASCQHHHCQAKQLSLYLLTA